jgi:hypothetical protein
VGELPHLALQVREDSIAPLALECANSRFKASDIIEHVSILY